MSISSSLSDKPLLVLLGARLAGSRLAINMTQGELAERAGLGLRTIQRLEQGASATQLSGFLRVCRVLGLLDRIDALIPEASVSPVSELKLQRRQRRRATRKKPIPKTDTGWTWGPPT